MLPAAGVGAAWWIASTWVLASSRAISLGLAVAAMTLALFALLGNVTEWARAARSISAALWLGAACRWSVHVAGHLDKGLTAAPAGAAASGGAFDLSNAVAAVLAVVLAVTTLIATKTATDARDEIRRLMEALQQERERDIERCGR